MKKLGLFLFLTIILSSSILSAQTLKGFYTGKYIFTTGYNQPSETSEEYLVKVHFTENQYDVIYHLQGDCDLLGKYEMFNDSVLFEQLIEACTGTTPFSDKNHYEIGSVEHLSDSVIITFLSGDTLKSLRLLERSGDYNLLLYIDDYIYPSNTSPFDIQVHLVNPIDSVVSITLFLQMDRPDIAEFSLTFDTAGTLMSGWDIIHVRSVSGLNTDILITALADVSLVPVGLGPQSGDLPLIKLGITPLSVPAFVEDRTARVYINTDFRDFFIFGDPQGDLIGYQQELLQDTTWYNCTAYAPPPNDNVCLNWVVVSGPPADSFSIEEQPILTLDTSVVWTRNGSITLPVCGNMNALDNQFDISDLLYLVDYFFLEPSGPGPLSDQVANVDGAGTVDISDLLLMVDYFFGEGTPVELCP